MHNKCNANVLQFQKLCVRIRKKFERTIKMKKKIITLALAVVMCLSVITSVTASEPLKRVASKIPGTDRAYNYVENVIVKIPGTDVTFELENVAETVGYNYDYAGSLSEHHDFPEYIFMFYDNRSKVTVNQNGRWEEVLADEMIGYASSFFVEQGEIFCANNRAMVTAYSTFIYNDNSCKIDEDEKGFDNAVNVPVAIVQFWFVNDKYISSDMYDNLYAYSMDKYFDISEIAVFDEIDEPLYSIIDGANSVVTSNSLTVRADGEFSKFTGVKVDGKLVDSSNYTASEDSTIIEFKADYLKTLDAGKHTVSIVFTDGEAVTNFEIKNADTSNTGNNTGSDNLVTDVEIPNTDYDTSVGAAFVAMTFSGIALLGLKKKSK